MKDLLHRGTVLTTDYLTPGMIRIVFGGDGLGAFETSGVGDEYLRLHFPVPGTGELVLPRPELDWSYPEGVERSPAERYTVRRYDPERGEVTFDFVVHDGGAASSWAKAARPGDELGIGSPRGLYDPPAGVEHQLLAADATGLPAVGRLVEQLPAGTRATVIVEVADASHEQVIHSPADVRYVWLHGAGNGIGPSRLEAAVRTLARPGTPPGYVWVAGESRAVRGIRRYLRHDLALPARMYKVVSYWQHASKEWEDRWAALDPTVRQRLDDAFDSMRDHAIRGAEGDEASIEKSEEILDSVEETMERAGL
ncbi:siderophore-interacting protein [Streptomyces albipurpureus]|uniref:Siderophore-interacting protein n=1 Tax=Streptomyces albipurpureus TaxID=2897419 RepID=A0ABT0UPH9_9ACTN|nr:siderophore-interacting protein [Streptomyces sp. CWNU-1]MCM2389500.1 siderophore-interacting protein [Streptomyces sp. CWNU-1]